jgi:HD-like signal output (HDOD) protein
MSITINQLFDQIDNVPNVPEVVRTLLKQVNNPNIDFAPIAENVEKEQAISIKVLRLVNSAHYGLPNQIGSIKQALVILGIDELKKLFIMSGFISAISDVPGLNLEDFWLDNYRTATYAQWIAEQSKLDNIDLIFTAGLINNLGTVLIHLGAPDIAKKIELDLRRGKSRIDAEHKHLYFLSQEITAELCSHWQFSEELIEVIIKSAEPLSFDDISLSSCAISVARYISQSTYSEKSKEEILNEFPYDEWKKLGLDSHDIEANITVMLELDTGIDGLLD